MRVVADPMAFYELATAITSPPARDEYASLTRVAECGLDPHLEWPTRPLASSVRVYHAVKDIVAEPIIRLPCQIGVAPTGEVHYHRNPTGGSSSDMMLATVVVAVDGVVSEQNIVTPASAENPYADLSSRVARAPRVLPDAALATATESDAVGVAVSAALAVLHASFAERRSVWLRRCVGADVARLISPPGAAAPDTAGDIAVRWRVRGRRLWGQPPCPQAADAVAVAALLHRTALFLSLLEPFAGRRRAAELRGRVLPEALVSHPEARSALCRIRVAHAALAPHARMAGCACPPRVPAAMSAAEAARVRREADASSPDVWAALTLLRHLAPPLRTAHFCTLGGDRGGAVPHGGAAGAVMAAEVASDGGDDVMCE